MHRGNPPNARSGKTATRQCGPEPVAAADMLAALQDGSRAGCRRKTPRAGAPPLLVRHEWRAGSAPLGLATPMATVARGWPGPASLVPGQTDIVHPLRLEEVRSPLYQPLKHVSSRGVRGTRSRHGRDSCPPSPRRRAAAAHVTEAGPRLARNCIEQREPRPGASAPSATGPPTVTSSTPQPS